MMLFTYFTALKHGDTALTRNETLSRRERAG